VTPLRALIIIIFLLENDMWGLGCYINPHKKQAPTTTSFTTTSTTTKDQVSAPPWKPPRASQNQHNQKETYELLNIITTNKTHRHTKIK